MPSVSLRVHHSQFPENVHADLLNSLRSRAINHKFHYDSIKQANKWLALHEKYSPARQDPACIAIYDDCFERASRKIGTAPISVIGLGCGGGQKETQLLTLMARQGIVCHFLAVDVSPSLVVTSQQRAGRTIGENRCNGLVCDMETAEDLAFELASLAGTGRRRLITFFGLIPNFEPQQILGKLVSVLQPEDTLLFSANLAPGLDYHRGVETILPLYQNAETGDWLMTFLHDLGVEHSDGALEFGIEDVGQLKRVIVHFHFRQSRRIRIGDETIQFNSGERVRLFFSYRHTPATISRLLGNEGIEILDQFLAPSGEEGVFLCRKRA